MLRTLGQKTGKLKKQQQIKSNNEENSIIFFVTLYNFAPILTLIKLEKKLTTNTFRNIFFFVLTLTDRIYIALRLFRDRSHEKRNVYDVIYTSVFQ